MMKTDVREVRPTSGLPAPTTQEMLLALWRMPGADPIRAALEEKAWQLPRNGYLIAARATLGLEVDLDIYAYPGMLQLTPLKRPRGGWRMARLCMPGNTYTELIASDEKPYDGMYGIRIEASAATVIPLQKGRYIASKPLPNAYNEQVGKITKLEHDEQWVSGEGENVLQINRVAESLEAVRNIAVHLGAIAGLAGEDRTIFADEVARQAGVLGTLRDNRYSQQLL